MVEAAAGRDEVLAGVERQGARLQPFGAAGPQLGAGALARPAGEAHVVGVEMGRHAPGSTGRPAMTPCRSCQRSRLGWSASPASISGPAGSSSSSQTLTWSSANGSAKRTPSSPGDSSQGSSPTASSMALVGQRVSGREPADEDNAVSRWLAAPSRASASWHRSLREASGA